jgi:methionyl-tRNA formyltransferase
LAKSFQQPCKIAFAGSPEFAATVLQRLQASDFACGLVLTQPDRPKGRGRTLSPNAVKSAAIDYGLPILQPTSLRDETAIGTLTEFSPDVLIVAAYGLLLPQQVLDLPTFGCLNVHASLLPRWRGAAPIERAVMAGDESTGVSIMQMEKGLDTGPVYATASITMAECAHVGELEEQLARRGGDLMVDVLQRLLHNPDLQPTPQPEVGACYANKLSAPDRLIDWHCSAEQITRQIWALSHRMPAITRLNDTQIQLLSASPLSSSSKPSQASMPGQQVASGRKAILVACGEGLLQIETLKVARGKGLVMDAAAARNGYPDLFDEQSVFTAGAVS